MTSNDRIKTPLADEGFPSSIMTGIKLVRGLWYLLATLFALFAFVNSEFPKAFGKDTFLGDACRSIINYFFDRPAFVRQEEARSTVASTSGAEGYVYYEISKQGDLTSSGRLKLTKGAMQQFETIRNGEILIAADEVYLRSSSTTSAQLSGIVGKDQCVEVVGVEKKVPVKTTVASSGGWLPVRRVKCP